MGAGGRCGVKHSQLIVTVAVDLQSQLHPQNKHWLADILRERENIATKPSTRDVSGGQENEGARFLVGLSWQTLRDQTQREAGTEG
jgi:hypothetical protein